MFFLEKWIFFEILTLKSRKFIEVSIGRSFKKAKGVEKEEKKLFMASRGKAKF